MTIITRMITITKDMVRTTESEAKDSADMVLTATRLIKLKSHQQEPAWKILWEN